MHVCTLLEVSERNLIWLEQLLISTKCAKKLTGTLKDSRGVLKLYNNGYYIFFFHSVQH